MSFKGFSTTVNPEVTARSLGAVNGQSTSDTATIKACFPNTPNISHDQLVEIFKTEVFGTQKGFMFDNEVYLDYNHPQAPDFTPDSDKAIDANGEKIPSHFIPNPTSPGPGSFNVTDKPEAPAEFAKHAEQWGNGSGTKESPKTLGENMVAARDTFGIYVRGESPKPSA